MIRSPAVASTVHASRSPSSSVPEYWAPFASGPPSSPGAVVTGEPVFAIVIRYPPVPE